MIKSKQHSRIVKTSLDREWLAQGVLKRSKDLKITGGVTETIT